MAKTTATRYHSSNTIKFFSFTMKMNSVVVAMKMSTFAFMWIEEFWDHKFLAWNQDPLISNLVMGPEGDDANGVYFDESLVYVPFNPTAENLAKHLVKVIGPQQLAGTDVVLTKVVIDETAKCSVEYSL